MIPWNKGKTNIYSEETLEKMSLAKLGNSPWNKGKDYPAPWLDEHRYKTGHECWKKGKIGIHSEEVRKSFGNGVRGRKLSEEHKAALLKSLIGHKNWNKKRLTEEVRLGRRLALNRQRRVRN